MLKRRYLFPNVIELNYQAAARLGPNIYLIDGGSEWLLLDTGFEDTVDEIIELIRQMDFSFSKCKMIVATHADADHIQGIGRARERLKAPLAAHPHSKALLEAGDVIQTYALIAAQNIEIPLKPTPIDLALNEGDTIQVGDIDPESLAHPRPRPRPVEFPNPRPALQRR